MALQLRLLFPLALLASTVPAYSQNTIHVPGDQPTIQAGINAAHDGDTVLVAPGVYYENIDFSGKNIIVTSGATSSAGAANTIIQAPASEAAVAFQSGETTAATLNGFTITHQVDGGSTVLGDGVAVAYASPNITNNVVANNRGCGISAMYASSLLLQGNEVTGQQIISVPVGYSCGPPRYSNQSQIKAEPITIGSAGSIRIVANYVHDNLGQNAHAIYTNNSSSVVLLNNIVQDNPGAGSQVVIETIPNISVIQNLITGTIVGAFGVLNGSNASAPYETRSVILTNNTFATTGTHAAGILAVVDYADISNNIFVDNGTISAFDWDPFECSLEPSGATIIFSHNDAYSSGNVTSQICASSGQNIGNISADPQFLSASTNNFHVDPVSPVVAAGDITAAQIPSADLDNKAREVCGTIDMGVYEVRPHPPVSIVGNPNPAIGGSNVSFTIKVQGNCNVPTGQVSVFDGSTLIATLTLDASGSANFSTSLLTVGNHNLTVTYPGDFNFEASNSPVYVEVILGDPSMTTLQVTPNPAQALQPITFSTSVSSPVGTPSGTITFYAGSTALATVALNASGQASTTLSTLGAGTYTITAVYNATTQFISSTSAPVTLVVNGAVTSTTLASAPNPSSFGQTVTFSVNVHAALGTVVSAGTITLTDEGTTLGTAALDNSGKAIFSISTLAIGSHTIMATYGGSSNFNASNASLIEVITTMQSSVALTASPNPAAVNQTVRITASATSSTGMQVSGGTATFYDGVAALGIASVDDMGHASFSTTALSIGTHNLTAIYSGNATFATSTSSVDQETILPSAFTLNLSPSTITLHGGQPGSTRIQLTSVGLFAGPLTLSYGTLPMYGTASIDPQSVALTVGATNSSTLTISTFVKAANSDAPRIPRELPLVFSAGALLLLLPCGMKWRRRGLKMFGFSFLLLTLHILTGCTNAFYKIDVVAPGNYQIPVTAMDANGNSQTATLTLVVIP